MADNKKYYYLKLKDNFFDSDACIILESMPDGYLYSNILLKLYLRSLKFQGRLVYNDRIPYNSTILAQVTRHKVGVIEKALKIFKKLDLIEVLNNGEIYMLDIQNYIGHSSTEADRQRDYYSRIKSLKDETMLGTLHETLQESSKIPTPEREREKELDIKLKKKINADHERIFNHWNSCNIQKTVKVTEALKKQIKESLKEYGAGEICEYITRYSTVVKDKDYYFDHVWTLIKFLKQGNGISDFTDEGEKWVNYLSWKVGDKNGKANNKPGMGEEPKTPEIKLPPPGKHGIWL